MEKYYYPNLSMRKSLAQPKEHSVQLKISQSPDFSMLLYCWCWTITRVYHHIHCNLPVLSLNKHPQCLCKTKIREGEVAFLYILTIRNTLNLIKAVTY